jgi:hypothetical protein
VKHVVGHAPINWEVADFNARAHDLDMRHGVLPCFKVHANIWNEHFDRVEQVGALVQALGLPFQMTLDHCQVISKIHNLREQRMQGMNKDIAASRQELDPARPGHLARRWVAAGYVALARARDDVPDSPVNIWGRQPDGSPGRGIQYPFVRPMSSE